MPDPRKQRQGGDVTNRDLPSRKAASPEQSSKTEGTNRDFDESRESKNQKHGHPREERDGS